jgi:ubiquinone/menaquinone biosynthesis C-methylase UbiE
MVQGIAYSAFSPLFYDETQMKQSELAEQQFGNMAQSYLTSAVHANGQDLEMAAKVVARYANANVLDLGCGAGHVSFAVAPRATMVTAFDPSQQMLDVVASAAAARDLSNIATVFGRAEDLPFANESFDVVITRFSAHHWADVPAALEEVYRVLRPTGVLVVIDIVAPEIPLYDTILQTVEILRDASHVRDYRTAEWTAMLDTVGLHSIVRDKWKLKMAFDEWVARMRTSDERVVAIHSIFNAASDEAVSWFSIEANHSFVIEAALFEAKKD